VGVANFVAVDWVPEVPEQGKVKTTRPGPGCGLGGLGVSVVRVWCVCACGMCVCVSVNVAMMRLHLPLQERMSFKKPLEPPIINAIATYTGTVHCTMAVVCVRASASSFGGKGASGTGSTAPKTLDTAWTQAAVQTCTKPKKLTPDG
jgi:hypothetical protein